MRAFSAIDVPDKIREKIFKFQKILPRQSLSFVQRKAMHITLHFFENINESQAAIVSQAISNFNTAPFEVEVNGVSYFGKGSAIRVIYAKVNDSAKQISALYSQISQVLIDSKTPFDHKYEYVPHITIARCKDSPAYLKDIIMQNQDHMFGKFISRKVLLQKSTLTPLGSEYTLLHESKV